MKNEYRRAVAGVFMMATSSIALAQSAFAQTETPPASDTQAAAAQQQDEGSGLADIVVTASRFEENVQKTPLIISVIDADALRGITQVTQLTTVNPGIQISVNGGLTQTFIRGVGSNTVLTGQEAAVAYNVDGVYLFSASMISPLMYDLERIEALKGPQGTLYGRNASGGAVNLITTGARLGRTEGYVEGEIGNFSRFRGTGAVNVPIGDTFAVRIAGQHVQHDGYLSDGTDDQKLTAGRIRARWEPSADVTLQFGADVSHQGGNGVGTTINPNPTGNKWVGGFDPLINSGLPSVAGGTALLTTQTDPTFLDNDQWSVNAQLDVNLGFATLTVLPAYRHEKGRYRNYGPGFGDNQRYVTNEKTLEARLANRTDQLKWVLGAYYFKNDNSGVSNVRQEKIFNYPQASVEFNVESYAFFGEATFSVSDTFRLIGGLRYTHESTKIDGQANGQLSAPGTPVPNTPAYRPGIERDDYPITGKVSANALTWKGGAELDLSPSSLLFATASRGFKGGGVFANRPGLPNEFKPEYLTAFELGSRNRFLDNTLQLNGELFYWKLKNQQQTFLTGDGGGGVTLRTTNAGKAHMYGGTIDMVWQPTPNDSLRAAVEYTKSEYDSFVRSIPIPFAAVDLGLGANTECIVTPTGASADVDCSGLPLPRSPKWAISAGYEHRFDLANGGNITFNGDMNYTSSRYLSINYRESSRQKGVALFNASLEYETDNKAITFTGWIRNIANTRVMTGAVEFLTPTIARVTVMPRRTFGGTIRYAF